MFPVDLHAHTLASTHAYSTLHDYISQAQQRGIKLFAITDHGPEMEDAPHYWHFMNMRIWPRLVGEVGILRGIEANIKNVAGDIDCVGIMWDQMDLVIGGFHEPVFPPQNREIHTEALINAMRSGQVHIISHPGNPKFPIDIDRVAEVAAECEVALELNNSSFIHSRKGSEQNCLAVAKAVKQAGGWLSLGSDSHTAFTLGEFDHCIEILQQVDLPTDRVLNASPRRLLDFLERRGKPVIAEFSHF